MFAVVAVVAVAVVEVGKRRQSPRLIYHQMTYYQCRLYHHMIPHLLQGIISNLPVIMLICMFTHFAS